jgi:putative hydrolase of the HAD superfamily
VIFDLWDTLVEWPIREAEVLRERLAALVAVSDEEFADRWSRAYRPAATGPLAAAYLELGIPSEHVEGEVAARHEFGRRVLRPRSGAVAALAALRAVGIKLAVLSVCSEEVPAVWAETELAGLFDVETFSSDCGLMKPDSEIYLLTAEALGVEPADCLFVGDGANDELRGAEGVGMTPVLFLPEGKITPWPEVRAWTGLRVTSIEEVRELC